jgi:hypothetical protein
LPSAPARVSHLGDDLVEVAAELRALALEVEGERRDDHAGHAEVGEALDLVERAGPERALAA